MPKHAAAAIEDELPSPEEIERRRGLLAEIRALRSHPLTEEERDFWREFDEEVALEKSRGSCPWPPVDAPVTPEEMEKRRRIAARIEADMAKPTTEEDEKLWQEFLDLGKERLTFR
ncbi:MAG TPA: hypothetical protein VIA62_19995 [Thermoanaerobaculia bacterium]|nr:hypothetical protein [Thermoanaerobaculia bacterium]